MSGYLFVARNLKDTDRLGKALAAVLPCGTTVALCGTLGAGKTRLVQAIAAACGVPRDQIVSPTFVLCHEYSGTRTIYHLDAYRLDNCQEFEQLGPEEFFQSSGLTVIEWADRVLECLPQQRLEIQIEIGDQDERRFYIVPYGDRLQPVIKQLATYLT